MNKLLLLFTLFFTHFSLAMQPGEPVERVIHVEESCPICQELFVIDGPAVVHTPCGHMFHRDCIARWLAQNNTCPGCRAEVQGDGLIDIPAERLEDILHPRAENGYFGLSRKNLALAITGAGCMVGGCIALRRRGQLNLSSIAGKIRPFVVSACQTGVKKVEELKTYSVGRLACMAGEYYALKKLTTVLPLRFDWRPRHTFALFAALGRFHRESRLSLLGPLAVAYEHGISHLTLGGTGFVLGQTMQRIFS